MPVIRKAVAISHPFVTPTSGRGLVIPVLYFRLYFFGGHLSQTSLGQTNTRCDLSVNISIIFSRIRSIRQNIHERRCRKLLGIQWHKRLFDESKEKYVSKL